MSSSEPSSELTVSGFTDSVKKWVAIDNKIKMGKEAIGALNKEKTSIGKALVDFMKIKHIDTEPIGITGGKLKVCSSKRSVPVNREYIEQRLEDYFHNEAKAKEVAEFIYADRETVEVSTLKRFNERAKKPSSDEE